MEASLISASDCDGTPFTICTPKDSGKVIDFLRSGEYEICASAGCPFILPISKLPQDKVFINSHPSALPFGKGIHPINECIIGTHKKSGSTLHYLIDKLDAGDIIHQATFDITDDIDLDLLYTFIFKLEQEVFDVGLEKVLSANLKFVGTPQSGTGTYYSRKPEDQNVDARNIATKDFLTKVRAFSSENLGAKVTIDGMTILAFRAQEIENRFIIDRYNATPPGSLIFATSRFLLLRLKDGLVRVDRWRTSR